MKKSDDREKPKHLKRSKFKKEFVNIIFSMLFVFEHWFPFRLAIHLLHQEVLSPW